MKRLKRIVLIALSWPVFLIGYLFVLIKMALLIAKGPRFDGLVLVTTYRDWVVKPRRFLAKIRWPFGRVSHLMDVSGSTVEHRSWWKFSMNIATGRVMQPDAGDQTVAHENVHLRQFQDAAVGGFLTALLYSLLQTYDVDGRLQFFAIWLFGVATMLANFLTAVLRDTHIYRDAEHERSAYAQTDRTPHLDPNEPGISWLERHLRKERKF